MSGLLRFWLSHRAELAGADRPARAAGRRVDAFAVAIGVPLGIFAARRPRLSAPLVGARQPGADDSESRDVRLSAAAASPRRRRPAHRDRRLDPLRPAADRPDDHRRPAGHRSVDPRSRRGDGHDRQRAAAPGRAAAGDAVDRRRHSRRGRGRRRLGDDRRGDRRRRPRRIHLSRPVDGRHDGHPGGRDSGRGARPDGRRRPAVARAAARAAPPSPPHHVLAAVARSPARCCLAPRWPVSSASVRRSSSARRTSPSS